MENQLATTLDSTVLEQVLIGGDLSKLTSPQRVQYYQKVCESIGLNPLTKPFEYITLNNKLTLYAKKDATDQLRKLQGVNIDDVDIVETATQFIVKVKGHNRDGRTDVEVGVVNKTDMQGNTANAQMKAVTKGKRRLTLSLCGLGWLDETEIESIPAAKPIHVDVNTGEIDPAIDAEIIHTSTNHVQPTNGKMSLEMAKSMVDSKDVKFGDMTRAELAGHATEYAKRAKDNGMTQEQRDQNQMKLDAAKLLMATPTA